MATCGSDSGIINVRRLPVTEVIGAGDYIIVDSSAGQTSIIDFSNFIIGLENTTFQVAFETLQDDMTLFGLASSDWDSTWTTVATNSAIWNKFDADVFNITCWDNTCSTMTATSANWNTAYDWGNHAVAGYMLASAAGNLLTTEVDPTVASHIKTITTAEKNSWNTVYGLVGPVGLASANKMLIVDSNRDIGNIRNLTVTGEIRAAGDIIAFNQGNPGFPGGGGGTVTAPIKYVFQSNSLMGVPAYLPGVTYSNIVGQRDFTKGYSDIYPPAGYTMDDFIAFTCSPAEIWYQGVVDGNDISFCEWHGFDTTHINTPSIFGTTGFSAYWHPTNKWWFTNGKGTLNPTTGWPRNPDVDRIRVWCNNTEARRFGRFNYLAIWGK